MAPVRGPSGRTLKHSILFLGLFLFLPAALAAQGVTTGALSGTVVSSTGEDVVGHDRRGAWHVFTQPAPPRSVAAGVDDEPLPQHVDARCRQRANHDHSRSGRHRVAGKGMQDHPLWVMCAPSDSPYCLLVSVVRA